MAPWKLSRWLALSWSERRLMASAVVLLPAIWASLRVVGFTRTHAWASRVSGTRAPRPSPINPAGLGTLVNMSSRVVPFASTCLTRSLTLLRLLGRRGVRAELRIGVRAAEGRISSHAWVEHDGRPINETPAVSKEFARLERLHPRARR